jgi:hypothetical protein
MTELKVGELYNVPCAEIVMEQGRNYFIPVIGNLHNDTAFGFPHEHYHIDGRFQLDPRTRHHFNLNEGYTSAVILPGEKKDYLFKGIVAREMLCIRVQTGLAIPKEPTERQRPKVELYRAWYESFLGHQCAGRKCPHLGTEMLESNGRLVCPLHNLTADIGTGKIIEA